ncbi:MAG: hypothetical protein IBX62_08915 [Coriobacteriia bacterium]|nr:hypothetical protein [Coriobacteriia bacterium]
MKVRKASIAIAVLAAALLLMVPAAAYANFSIHGGYTMDTDACAGCHRAHTAASPITWSTGTGSGSALLISTATENYQFCYTCHDAVSLGADTNVETGIYEGTLVGNTPFGMLNGGGFDETIFPAAHLMNGTEWGAYGGGENGINNWVPGQAEGEGPKIQMSCSSCHDVHGSSNYRLLKDLVNGVQVGGYIDSGDPQNPTPDPWVISNEPGYPGGGWLLHEPGAVQVDGYDPNYTTPMYAKAPGEDVSRGMSVWCAACHTQYVVQASEYNAGDGWGFITRHRHPVNVPLSNFAGARSLIITGNPLPVAHGSGDVGSVDATDWIDCMTCHVAHGSSAVMTGYANIDNATDPLPDSGSGGVPPTNSNALLRMDNRGVCENCHNK